MFTKPLNGLTIDKFSNKGVALEMDKKYYLISDNNEIGINDNMGNYFFSVKGKSTIDYEVDGTSCGVSADQSYKLIFVSNCSKQLWIFAQLNLYSFPSTDNISSIIMTIESISESKVTNAIYVTEVEVSLRGDINNCQLVDECCC